MRLRFGVLATALVVLVTACSSGGGNKNSSGPLGGSGTTPTTVANAACNKPLTSPEIGVSPKTITVTTLADVNNVVRPGLFRGSWLGMQAWANYINATGGLACRQVKVDLADAKLNPTDAAAGIATACKDSVATVGTTALFLNDVSVMNSCKDKAGTATGLPDIAELQTEAAQQCSPVSFAEIPTSYSCPYDDTKGGVRTYYVGQTQYDYYLNKFGAHALHGVFVFPSDLASTKAATVPIVRAENQMGITSDAEFGKSGEDTQPAYTEVAQAIKTHNSTYARNGLDYKGTVLMRKEAQAQGVTSVKVWDCSLQCYDKRLITEGGSAVQGQYVWLNFLPLEDGASANPELANFLKYDKTPDAFGIQSWLAGEIFAQAVRSAVASHGDDPNALTRADILAAVKGIHDFTANGLVPKLDIGNKKGSACLVGMQVQGTKFVRVDPTTPGTFDCDNNKPPIKLTLDPVKEYHAAS
jgi:hypothetical protein